MDMADRISRGHRYEVEWLSCWERWTHTAQREYQDVIEFMSARTPGILDDIDEYRASTGRPRVRDVMAERQRVASLSRPLTDDEVNAILDRPYRPGSWLTDDERTRLRLSSR